ncbi:MAG: SapC family protein [Chlorobiaceae bacterium]
MENKTNPRFYRNPVPLNSEAHATLTLSPNPEGYSFASKAWTILLAAPEFYDAVRQFPVIFTVSPDERIFPVALMGLEEDENLFIDDKGNWLGQYIPAYIRRYPFITTDGSEGQMTVCIDEEFEGFNLEGGIPLFEEGEPTEKTKEIQAFLQDYNLIMDQTAQFGALLKEKELLRQIDAQANLRDGRTYALKGMLVVDEEKLAKLSDTDVLTLFRNGAMPMIHAHLLSLRNLNTLIDLKTKRG